jgi:hypothetical protein
MSKTRTFTSMVETVWQSFWGQPQPVRIKDAGGLKPNTVETEVKQSGFNFIDSTINGLLEYKQSIDKLNKNLSVIRQKMISKQDTSHLPVSLVLSAEAKEHKSTHKLHNDVAKTETLVTEAVEKLREKQVAAKTSEDFISLCEMGENIAQDLSCSIVQIKLDIEQERANAQFINALFIGILQKWMSKKIGISLPASNVTQSTDDRLLLLTQPEVAQVTKFLDVAVDGLNKTIAAATGFLNPRKKPHVSSTSSLQEHFELAPTPHSSPRGEAQDFGGLEGCQAGGEAGVSLQSAPELSAEDDVGGFGLFDGLDDTAPPANLQRVPSMRL